jgi:hypothetical protein
MTESWPDRIIEVWRPSVAFRMILSRHDSVWFVRLLCRNSPPAAGKLKDCTPDEHGLGTAEYAENEEGEQGRSLLSLRQNLCPSVVRAPDFCFLDVGELLTR